MKILHLDFDDPESPAGGGQAVRTFEINRRLVQKGHNVTVVTMNYPGAKNTTREGVRYERIGLKRYPFNFISYFLSVPFILNKYDYDLVVEENIPPMSFGMSPLYTKKPVISQIQSLFAKQSSKKHHLPFWVVEKHAAGLYKNFIVLTRNLKREISKLNGKARIAVIPNGLTRVPEAHHAHKNQLLFLGRIDYHHKGIDHLLKTAEILGKKMPDLEIIVAGDGRDRARFLREFKTMGLKNLIYKGKVTGADKERLIKDSAALIMPSNFEILPFSMLEAASYGKPAIFFDIPNLHELIAENIGIGVPAYDPQKFAQSCADLLNDKERLSSLGRSAHAWAKRHLWDNIVNEQEKFYRTCLEQ